MKVKVDRICRYVDRYVSVWALRYIQQNDSSLSDFEKSFTEKKSEFEGKNEEQENDIGNKRTCALLITFIVQLRFFNLGIERADIAHFEHFYNLHHSREGKLIMSLRL